MRKSNHNYNSKQVEFLESFLKDLQRTYQIGSELCPCDFAPVPDDHLPTTDEKAERAARLADDNGLMAVCLEIRQQLMTLLPYNQKDVFKNKSKPSIKLLQRLKNLLTIQ